jgi:chitinase
VDWVNVMAYGMAGAWSAVTGFAAPLYDPADRLSADTTLRALLALGVPAEKLVLGVSFSGRGWSGVRPENHGLHQPFTGLPEGTWVTGAFDYGDLVARYIGKVERWWDEAAQVPWLYDPASGTMISYDDPDSLAQKAAYVRAWGLGGVMIWQLSQDAPDAALVRSLHVALYGS